MISAKSLVRRRLREGTALTAALKDVDASQWFDERQLQALQLAKVRGVVAHAVRHVPFYRALYQRHGVEPDAIQSLSDIARLPVIEKSDVLAAGEAIHARSYQGPRFQNTSSGTTGSHIAGYRDLHSIVRENALVWRQLQWAGMKAGDRRVWMRGDKIVPSRNQAGPFWRLNRADRTLMMSSYHLSEERTSHYLAAMEAFDPVAIQTYPSSIMLLASVMDARGRRYRGRSLKAIVTSSETISPSQRRLLQRVFGCPVFDWYGSFERVAAIGTCEFHHYHLLSDYSYTELHPHGVGGHEIVGTSFDNEAMPWIRYRMHDLVVPEAPGKCCECGRAFPLIRSLEGRQQDYLVAPQGRRIMMPVNAFDDVPGLMEGQFVQSANDSVSVLCRLAPGKMASIQSIEAAIRNYVGDALNVNVRLVQEIPRTANGKLRAVVRTVEC